MALDPGIESRIRSLIPDTDQIFGTNADQYLFSSQDLENFYLDGFNNTKYAAGLAKIAIGSSEALILKVIKNYETATDGAALAKQWLAMGKELISIASAEMGLDFADYFDIIEADVEADIEGQTPGFGPDYRFGVRVAQRGYYDFGTGGETWG